MTTDGAEEISEGDYKPSVTSLLIDKELCFQGETNHRDIVRIKADCEQDLWYALSIDYYDERNQVLYALDHLDIYLIQVIIQEIFNRI